MFVELKNGLLSVDATGRQWPAVLKELRRKTGITLRVLAPLSGTVSVSFKDVPVEVGFRRLFGADANLVMVYEGESAPSARLAEVWLLRDGEAPPAAVASGASSRPPVAPPQAAALPRSGSEAERLQAFQALAHRDDDEEAIAELVRALRDPSAEVRREAAEALGDAGDESAVQPLSQLLALDRDRDVRLMAVDALGQIGAPEALHSLRHALQDSEAVVRTTAVEAIAEIGGREAMVILRAATKGRDAEVRKAAGEALKDLDGGER